MYIQLDIKLSFEIINSLILNINNSSISQFYEQWITLKGLMPTWNFISFPRQWHLIDLLEEETWLVNHVDFGEQSKHATYRKIPRLKK